MCAHAVAPAEARLRPRLGYRPALDGLRAVAVIAVVLYHAWPAVAPGGFIGVDLFFVLSGFLITTILLEEHARTGTIHLPSFYARRALRLLPALAVLLVASAAIASAVAPQTAAQVRLGVLASVLYFADFLKASGAPLSILGHTWSLAIEEQFYLVWPVALWLLLRRWDRRRALAVCLAGLVVVPLLRVALWSAGASADRIYFAPDTRADSLLAGCALAVACQLGLLDRVPAMAARTAALIAPLGLAALVAFGAIDSGVTVTIGFTVTAALAASVIALTVVRPLTLPVRLLSLPPLVGVGRISYGVYLWHYPLVLLLAAALHTVPGPLVALTALPASLVAARASHLLVERPCLTLKGRMAGRQLALVRAAATE
jgi:peptidoglycan/LPS O-acetylase OafA/YrhL